MRARGWMMKIDAWLQSAVADAERRGLPELKPLLEALAKTVATVRAADFNVNASSDAKPGHESR